MLSLSEMYHDTFTNQKKYTFLCRRLIKKERQMHAYILFVKFMHTFLAKHVNLLFVQVMILIIVFSLLSI